MLPGRQPPGSTAPWSGLSFFFERNYFMRSLSLSSSLLLTLALCSCAGESADSTPGDEGPIGTVQQAWVGDMHVWLTQRAAQLANQSSPPPPLTLPWNNGTLP